MSDRMGNLAGKSSAPNTSIRTIPSSGPWPPVNNIKVDAIGKSSTSVNATTIKAYLNRHGYTFGEILGEGSYSKVKLCRRYSTVDGSYMYKLACKIIDKSRASNDFVAKFLPRELQILRQLNHHNVVRVWDIVHFPDHVYIFMDCCDGGDLLEYVKCQGVISESRSRHYFSQLISAVRYLHKMDIAHRDLKCENVLMTAKDQIKISDFGFSRFCRNAEAKRILSDTYCGSAAYAAPEILMGTSYNPKLYDMWSLGCILFIMLTGHMPFDETDIPNMLKIQLERSLAFPPEIEKKLSVSAIILVRRLLEPDVTRRGNIEHAANHEWTRLQPFRSQTPASQPSTSNAGGDRLAAPILKESLHTFTESHGGSTPSSPANNVLNREAEKNLHLPSATVNRGKTSGPSTQSPHDRRYMGSRGFVDTSSNYRRQKETSQIPSIVTVSPTGDSIPFGVTSGAGISSNRQQTPESRRR